MRGQTFICLVSNGNPDEESKRFAHFPVHSAIQGSIMLKCIDALEQKGGTFVIKQELASEGSLNII